jgi:DNA primase
MSQVPEEVSTETYYELPNETPAPNEDPIARTLEALAQQQIQQSKIMEEIARRQNSPVPVTIQQMATPPATSDPIDVMQADINNLRGQLDTLRQNGDIDDTEYWTKYQSLIAPKVEQVKDLKHRRELEETKNSIAKTYDEKLAEQQKLLESIQNENKTKTEEQKLKAMIDQYPQLGQENSPLLVEMSKLLEDTAISSVFTDPRNNKDQYFALAKLADERMKARGASGIRPDMSITGQPNVYQGDSSRRVAFTADEVNSLKSEGYDDNGIMKLSNYAEQVKNTGSVTLIGWVARNG